MAVRLTVSGCALPGGFLSLLDMLVHMSHHSPATCHYFLSACVCFPLLSIVMKVQFFSFSLYDLFNELKFPPKYFSFASSEPDSHSHSPSLLSVVVDPFLP